MDENHSITWLHTLQQTVIQNHETSVIILLILVSFLVARKIPKTATLLKSIVMSAVQFVAQRCLHRQLTAPEEEVVEDVIENALGVTEENTRATLQR